MTDYVRTEVFLKRDFAIGDDIVGEFGEFGICIGMVE